METVELRRLQHRMDGCVTENCEEWTVKALGRLVDEGIAEEEHSPYFKSAWTLFTGMKLERVFFKIPKHK